MRGPQQRIHPTESHATESAGSCLSFVSNLLDNLEDRLKAIKQRKKLGINKFSSRNCINEVQYYTEVCGNGTLLE
jgi:hypothetical protein